MKTIKDYEEEFDARFDKLYLHKYAEGYEPYGSFECNNEVKDYIFQELLPQVLSEIIPNEIEKPYDYLDMGENTCIKMLKQKAKELYGIDL